jgi:hypothetical protein
LHRARLLQDVAERDAGLRLPLQLLLKQQCLLIGRRCLLPSGRHVLFVDLRLISRIDGTAGSQARTAPDAEIPNA